MIKYYFAEENKQKGPYSIEELKNNKISANTLVWREGLNNWVIAKELKELETLFKSTPPPLAKEKYNKIIHPSKVKDKLEVQKKKTKIAKEIKFTSRLFLFSIILGLLSYPFFAYNGFKAIYLKNKYVKYKSQFIPNDERTDKEIYKMDYIIGKKIVDLISKDERKLFTYHGKMTKDQPKWEYNRILFNKINDMKYVNTGQAFAFSIVSFLVMVFGRAIYFGSKKSINWIDENSKKDI